MFDKSLLFRYNNVRYVVVIQDKYLKGIINEGNAAKLDDVVSDYGRAGTISEKWGVSSIFKAPMIDPESIVTQEGANFIIHGTVELDGEKFRVELTADSYEVTPENPGAVTEEEINELLGPADYFDESEVEDTDEIVEDAAVESVATEESEDVQESEGYQAEKTTNTEEVTEPPAEVNGADSEEETMDVKKRMREMLRQRQYGIKAVSENETAHVPTRVSSDKLMVGSYKKSSVVFRHKIEHKRSGYTIESKNKRGSHQPGTNGMVTGRVSVNNFNHQAANLMGANTGCMVVGSHGFPRSTAVSAVQVVESENSEEYHTYTDDTVGTMCEGVGEVGVSKVEEPELGETDVSDSFDARKVPPFSDEPVPELTSMTGKEILEASGVKTEIRPYAKKEMPAGNMLQDFYDKLRDDQKEILEAIPLECMSQSNSAYTMSPIDDAALKAKGDIYCMEHGWANYGDWYFIDITSSLSRRFINATIGFDETVSLTVFRQWRQYKEQEAFT